MDWLKQFFAKPEWGFGRRLSVGALIGLATGFAAVGFRLLFTEISDLLLHTDGEGVARARSAMLFLVPTIGGLLVGLLTWQFFGRGAIPGVADVVLAQTRDRSQCAQYRPCAANRLECSRRLLLRGSNSL